MNSSCILRKGIDEILISQLEAGENIFEMKRTLQRYKDSGVSARAMTEYLERMRKENIGEIIDDRILEVLDISSGFCSPQLRVW